MKMVKNIILMVIALVIGYSSICFAGSYKLIQDKYVVQMGDSLDSITLVYMSKNTYGQREFKEFREGIMELNPWLLERDVHVGDEIRINYWVEAKEGDKK